MQDMRPLYTILKGHSTLFDRIIALETQKLDAITANDIEALDRHMKAEQALILELRGLDSKREQVLEQLGLSGFSMSRIVERSEGEQKEELSSLYAEITDKNEELAAIMECSRKFIELHLQSIEMLEAAMKAPPEDPISYGKTGKPKGDDDLPKFTSKKV